MVQLLQDIARASERRSQPFVTVFFGNPYTAMGVPEAPAMLLTYDFSDAAERSAVRAIAGEIGITGKLPITLPGLFPIGHGFSELPGPSSAELQFRDSSVLCDVFDVLGSKVCRAHSSAG